MIIERRPEGDHGND